MNLHDGWYWPAWDQLSHKAKWQRHLQLVIDQTLPLVECRDLCVQAGGAVGIWPMALSSRFQSVLTFEPDPDQFACLRANVTALNVNMRRAALGAAWTTGRTVHRDHRCNASYLVTGPGPVTVMPLDEELEQAFPDRQVGLLCLDIEGHELGALQGAKRVLERDRPVVQVEVKHMDRVGTTPEELDDWLHARGYQLDHERKYDKVYVPR